ncbi:hypothetical protein CORC01_11903 [Colletotrichum orchidophilum]|uniref:Infection structure specific protein n=1 Tax=Colletotrichum orchidophilum TaxID=1209926 RepID=A0A1G4AUN7_9PEZI|nr:uncharacterized protein CORC01_11903 [Colletotrichum orchidophilum]OHE92825.1 hypothetical protein CORC01_11903 [Colletotrichum orchidophilum]
MHYTNLLLIATSSGAIAAGLSDMIPKRAVRGLENRGLLACADVVKDHRSVTTDLPELFTALPTTVNSDDIPSITNPCELPTLTGWAGDALSSYTSDLNSWTSAHSSDLSSMWSACKDEGFVQKITSLAGRLSPVCSAALDFSRALDGTTTATATGAAATTTAAASTDTGSAPGATAGTGSTNAAPRETGMILVAAAAAGVAFAAIQ